MREEMLFFGPLLLLLLCVERALARVHGQLVRAELRVATELKGGGGGGGAAGGGGGGSRRPSMDTLLKEDSRGIPPFDEAAPLGDLEMGILRKIRSWVGDDAAFTRIKREFLVCFVRGFADRIDFNEACFAYLDATLRWRCARAAVDACRPARLSGPGAWALAHVV